MILKKSLFFLISFFCVGCATYYTHLSHAEPEVKKLFESQIYPIVLHANKVYPYPAAKKYKMRENEKKLEISAEDADRLLELLRSPQNYLWGQHKRAVFVPTIGFKLYTSEGSKVHVIFSSSAKQVRFLIKDSFLTVDCDGIAPEIREIADHILKHDENTINLIN